MRVLEYDLTSDDFVAFNVHFLTASPAGRKMRSSFRVQATLTALLSGAVIALIEKDPLPGTIVAGVLAPLVWLLAPLIWKHGARRNLNRIASRFGLGTPGRHRLVIDDVGLRECTPSSETLVPWSGIQRIDESREHAFVFFGPTQALVLPKSQGPERVAQFLAAVREHLGPEADGRGVMAPGLASPVRLPVEQAHPADGRKR